MTKRIKGECVGKVRYDTAAAAEFFAGADGLRSYRCPQCGGFHLSSSSVGRVPGRPPDLPHKRRKQR